jgi:transposase
MQRNKTDKLDSAVIASFCAKHHPIPCEHKSEEQRCLRALVGLRDDLLQTQLQQENRLRDATDELVRSSLQALLKASATEMAAVERRIKERASGGTEELEHETKAADQCCRDWYRHGHQAAGGIR